MDAKALAKSKRAHSQHHSKKSHPNQKKKAPSNGTNEAATAKMPLGKQSKDAILLSQPAPKLPSNWDRYGEEITAGSEETITEATAAVPDVVVPKSKGADYRYLIAEAQSQMQSCTFMDVFPSLDDFLPRDLSCGGSAMLAVMGERMLSWTEDDSFIVDEKSTVNPEASFLSLNLHTLAEQLQKLDVAERLFIEEDMLPSELRADGKAVCDPQRSQMQKSDCQDGTRDIAILSNTEFCEKEDTGDGIRDTSKASSSGCSGSILQNPTFNSSATSSSRAPKYTEQPNTNAIKKTTMLEATTAEAELDMLLGSFSENVVLDDSAAASSSSRIDDVFKASPHPPSKGPYSAMKAPIAADLDDALDDLLQDTSYLTSHKDKSVPIHIQSLSPHSETNSIAKDDFDSWLDSI